MPARQTKCGNAAVRSGEPQREVTQGDADDFSELFRRENGAKRARTGGTLPLRVPGLRLAVWEEHCLECTAPQCFQTCQNYLKRQDGVCRLFENSILQLAVPGTLYGIGAHVIFRKWGNLMTIVYPPVLTPEAALKLRERNRRFERAMGLTVRLKLPVKLRRAVIRTPSTFAAPASEEAGRPVPSTLSCCTLTATSPRRSA